MSLSSYYLDYVRYVTGLPHRHRRRAYLPKSNTASHDNDKKINSWVSFCFPYGYGAPLGGRSTNRSELRYKLHMCEPVKIQNGQLNMEHCACMSLLLDLIHK